MVQFNPMAVAAFDGIYARSTHGVTQGEIVGGTSFDRFKLEGGYSIDSKSLYGGLPVSLGIPAKRRFHKGPEGLLTFAASC
ncbi:hypothetical protein [Burkholderia cenocepacia]|uniref:hypothetical protein n=1 Tax=Burkholderia cenocepacia TaxID=95486 RepID=UPI000980E594|nr:hypothetical protein [Burkholderia cenocepacia]OOA17565.1 hypothetical protein A8F55_06850 [Burkholderia cenocepacia]